MRGFAGALVIISAAVLVACSGSPTAAPSARRALPALGVELPASEIPWDQVGPGWILATSILTPDPDPGQAPSDGQPGGAPVTLYLLDPVGGRYAITTFPRLPPDGPNGPRRAPRLADWSGDGRHAVFEDWFAIEGKTTVTEVDLATGTKQTFMAPGYTSVAYSRPTGQAILLSHTDSSNEHNPVLERVDLSGTKQFTFPTGQLGAAGKFSHSYLQTPDGKQLVLGADRGMAVIGNDGVIARQLPMPGPRTSCSPVRWWTSTVILAACESPLNSSPPPDPALQLWQVPLAGGAPTALTPVNGQDLGYGNAWQLTSAIFLNDVPGCGGDGLVFRMTKDMQVTQVTVPGVDRENTVIALGVTGDKLLVETSRGCGTRVKELRIYDPAANSSTVLLGPPVTGSLTGAMLYPSP
jgi:hypothetical protein